MGLALVIAAQGTWRLKGRVLDSDGRAVPGALVEIKFPDGSTRNTVTGSDGTYFFPNIPPGEYQVSATLSGFGVFQRSVRVGFIQAYGGEGGWFPAGDTDLRMPTGTTARPSPPPTPRRTPVAADGHPKNGGPKEIVAYWNSWVSRDDSGEVIAQTEEGDLQLKKGADYQFRFDLSAYDYARIFTNAVASVTAGEEVKREILATTAERLTAFVHPVIAGRGLRFAPNQGGTRELTITPKLLKDPPQGWDGQEKLEQFAARVKAGRVEMRLQAFESGCSSIGLSIWNKDLNIPLDYLERRVAITDESGKLPTCWGTGRGRVPSFRGSLLTLLGQSDGLVAGAALHIFEMKAGAEDPVRSVAVFLEKDGPAYSWVLRERLSTFTTSGEGLVRRLQLSRNQQNYRLVATALEKAIFDSESDEDRDRAQKALIRLKTLAASSKRGVFFARLVDLEGTSLFLPLGLLPASDTQFLGAAVDLIQPLPRESYAPSASCIRSWSVILPKSLGESVNDAYFNPVDLPLTQPIEKWNDFASYLESSPNTARAAAEGMLLLAHHGGGDVWFVPNQDVLRYSEISHKYTSGSAALLIMCSAGALTGEQPLAFLKQLNSLGVDAAIVSPFAISTPFGVRVAMHFANQIELARRDKSRITVLELLRRTTESIQKDTLIADQKDEVFEFILAGNGSLQMCFDQ